MQSQVVYKYCGISCNITISPEILTKKGTFLKAHDAFTCIITRDYYSLDEVLYSPKRNPLGVKKRFTIMGIFSLEEDDFIELPPDCTIQYLKDNNIYYVVCFV